MIIDIDRFEQHLFEPESSFEIILRGHLWIESLIEKILEIHIVNTGILDFDRMGFRQKIDIAQAFGFINQEDGRAFKALNRLRNKLAHNLMAEPSELEVRDLANLLTGPPKAAFDALINHPEVVRQADRLASLRYWFICYAMGLDHLYSLAKYRKDNHTKLAQVAGARYASRAFGGKELSEEEARSRFGLEPPPTLPDAWISIIDRNHSRGTETV